ncbi:MAG TPA: DUF6788 family protein [Acidimicrobiales bacterium]|jgi:hypothetical protein|nr:DUF6788 family protein [Acidimicrobiales bacterium]
MATKRTSTRLESYERRYRELAGQLADIGYIATGSVALRYNRCGKESCGCHADPPRLHGPYFQWTAKVGGKTVNRRLSPGEAALYNEWIGNDRRVRGLLVQMREVAAKAQQLMLEEIPAEPA